MMRNYFFVKISQCLFLIFCLCNSSVVSAQFLGDAPGQAIQISSDLHSFEGKPSWLLIVRNMDTGAVMPYLFDFGSGQNVWVQVVFARHYRIIESTMNFGPPPCAKIRNYCHLEDGILTNQSFMIRLAGDLTPDRFTSRCRVRKIKDYDFPIVEQQASVQTSNDEPDTSEPPPTIPTMFPTSDTAVPQGAVSTVSNVISNILPK